MAEQDPAAEGDCAFPPLASPNTANCYDGNDYGIADVGSYPGSASPYGTFDQGGNVREWNEAISGSLRGIRGGSFGSTPSFLAAANRLDFDPSVDDDGIGLRVAMLPEASRDWLFVAGVLSVLGLAGWRKVRA